MQKLVIFICLLLIATLSGCDLRSETAKREMEKYTSSPTPPIIASPTKTPVDPKDILEVDTSLEGDTIHFNGEDPKKTVTCTKYNRVLVNGDKYALVIKGGCRQVMINGDGNDITAEAVTEFVLNGSENTVKYSRFVNGKQPNIVENKPGNVIEQISAEAAKGTPASSTKAK